jgi:TatD DNase family protein
MVQQVVREVPLDSLLIETDSPFLTPHPYRGKRNEPAYVRYVAEKIAELKDRSVDEVGMITSQNAERLFGWSVLA